MARGDRTGPRGQGPGKGRGMGRGGGRRGGGGALEQVLVETASALNVGKENLISWEAPAMRTNAPSVGRL